MRSVLHWAVTDIDGAAAAVSKGREAVAYKAPAPEWGNHRFVFLLFRQPPAAPGDGAPPLPLPAVRPGFNVAAWAAQHGLSLVGANFFCMHAPEFGGGGKRRR